MDFLVRRILAALAWAVGGLLLGAALGAAAGQTCLGAALGAVVASVSNAVLDHLRGLRLLRWARGPQDRPAPRDGGFWGDLGYRFERALAMRDRRAQEERDKLAQFLSAIDASPNGVLLLDERRQIAWSNATAALHFGLDPLRDLHQPITNLVRVPAFVAHLQQAELEQPLVFKAPGGQATLSVLVRPYGRGQWLVLSQDVTERERAETMRRDFVANVSHEIRTPLTVLAGYVETLGSVALTETERQRALVHMEQQTARMQALVADLLTLAQLEGSPRPPPDTWVPVRALLQRAQADSAGLSAGRHTLLVDTASEAELAADLGELHSALANLVSNAVRYTPVGGRIEVRWVDGADGGGAFEVRDDGPGIAREHLPRLTERFYRVDSGRSREAGGTGLGLAIVKHVMQRHGGQVDIESDPGKGSLFRLCLPALRVRRLAMGQSAASAPATLVPRPAPASSGHARGQIPDDLEGA